MNSLILPFIIFAYTATFLTALQQYICFRVFQFIHDQLHAKDDSKRQSHFHGSDDKISVEELWITWRKSEGN